MSTGMFRVITIIYRNYFKSLIIKTFLCRFVLQVLIHRNQEPHFKCLNAAAELQMTDNPQWLKSNEETTSQTRAEGCAGPQAWLKTRNRRGKEVPSRKHKWPANRRANEGPSPEIKTADVNQPGPFPWEASKLTIKPAPPTAALNDGLLGTAATSILEGSRWSTEAQISPDQAWLPGALALNSGPLHRSCHNTCHGFYCG